MECEKRERVGNYVGKDEETVCLVRKCHIGGGGGPRETYIFILASK
jgi:hypothetical protein